MDHIGPAWNAIKDNLVPYAVYVLVFTLVAAFTLGLGALVLFPNYYRGFHKALSAQAAPEVGDLFVFDHIGDDVVTMLLMCVALVIGFCLCVLPGIVLSVGFFWVPLLAASRAYEPVDALKASLYAVKAEPIQPLIFIIVMSVVNSFAIQILFLPYLVSAPVFLVAQILWFNQAQKEIAQAAAAGGVQPRV